MSRTLDDLHKIREKIYEEEKNMSKEEVLRKRRTVSEQFIEKYGLKLRRLEKSPIVK